MNIITRLIKIKKLTVNNFILFKRLIYTIKIFKSIKI